mmetsp:Transcript_18252/g.18451  ORF Transcript_18252/g.18451 Transcript_18252/m.18451 type:complete len:109 (-) Transcript_18252:222-548(-)
MRDAKATTYQKSSHEKTRRYHIIISLYENVKMLMCSAMAMQYHYVSPSYSSKCNGSCHGMAGLDTIGFDLCSLIIMIPLYSGVKIKDLSVILPKKLDDEIRATTRDTS